jgi:GNAT superfamily N-acetyltransferase
MTDFSLRSATSADLPRMIAVEIAAAKIFPVSVLPAEVGRSGSPDELQASVANGLAWVATVDQDLIVGFLAAQAINTSLHIVEMDVLPSHGRRGIGALLLEHAVKQCRALGLRETTLTTFLSVPWNGPFYAKYGFQPVRDASEHVHLEQALSREGSRGLKDRVAMLRNVA